jgi:GNAT superfamily N-acetyltransferase
MENLHFVEAVTPEQLLLMSQLHAMGWRTAYRGMIPSEYLDHHIREDGWVDRFQRRYAAGEAHGLLLYRGEKPVCCISYGDVRTDPNVLGGVLELGPESLDCAGWGEIHSFYAHPEETGRGYGSLVVEEVLRRFREEGRPGVCVFALRENAGACRFYEKHGFYWDGAQLPIFYPPDAVCVDLRYVQVLPLDFCASR